MKKFVLTGILLSLCVSPLSTFSVNINEVNDIFTSVEFIKESINFDDITIDSKVPYDLIQWVIKNQCSQSAIDQATGEIWKYKEILNSYSNNSKEYLSDKFNTVKWLIINQKKDDQYDFCKNSFLLFSVLKDTQDLYLWESQSNTNKEKKNKDNKTNKSSENTDKQLNKQKMKIIDFTFIHNTDALPNKVKQSYSESTDIYLQDILASLVNNNILDKSDLKILKNKIYVDYKQSCDFTEWAFRVVKDQNTEEYTFKDINLIIAYCDNDTSPNRHKRHTQQILAHELWHYVYFFKDKNSSIFSKICWDNDKSICQSEEFVSDYAQESPEEDYADTFAYRYLYKNDVELNNQSNILPKNPVLKKFKYFGLSFG